jgi:predicted DNA-binding transcriptional regulator AlpA
MKPSTSARVILWPKDVEVRYSISTVSRWRWERAKKLPPRDVHLAGEPVAWYLSTIEAAERNTGASASAAA